MTSTPLPLKTGRRQRCAGCGSLLHDHFREVWYCRKCQSGSRFWRTVSGYLREARS